MEALGRLSAAGGFGDLKVTFKRVLNISKDHQDPNYDVALFEEAEESALHDGWLVRIEPSGLDDSNAAMGEEEYKELVDLEV